MSEEEVLVAPLGLDEVALELNCADFIFLASEIIWITCGIDIVEIRTGWNRLKLRNVSHWIRARKVGWEQMFNIFMRLKSKRVWEWLPVL